MCVCVVGRHSASVSLSGSDVTTDEDGGCSSIAGGMMGDRRVSRAESIDSTYNELTDDDDTQYYTLT